MERTFIKFEKTRQVNTLGTFLATQYLRAWNGYDRGILLSIFSNLTQLT